MKKISLLLFLFLISFSVLSEEQAVSDLASKLVKSSPWRFTTKYESTVHHFRITNEGRLQRMSSGNPDVWVDAVVTEKRTIVYPTRNGHEITFYLDKDGNPTAVHSKHLSQFQSIK